MKSDVRKIAKRIILTGSELLKLKPDFWDLKLSNWEFYLDGSTDVLN